MTSHLSSEASHLQLTRHLVLAVHIMHSLEWKLEQTSQYKLWLYLFPFPERIWLLQQGKTTTISWYFIYNLLVLILSPQPASQTFSRLRFITGVVEVVQRTQSEVVLNFTTLAHMYPGIRFIIWNEMESLDGDCV